MTGEVLRVSDADRDVVVARLHNEAALGRLTLAEFEDRVEEALASRTSADLKAALRDLPDSRLRLITPMSVSLVGAANAAALAAWQVGGPDWTYLPRWAVGVSLAGVAFAGLWDRRRSTRGPIDRRVD